MEKLSLLALVVLFLGLASRCMVVTSTIQNNIPLRDQKNYYSPDPHAGTPPIRPPKTPHRRTPKTPTCGTPPPKRVGGGYYHSPPPTYGGRSPPTYGGSPPTYGGLSPPEVVTPPFIVSPPSIGGRTPPMDPGTPSTPMIPRTPPFIIGTCNFWKTHPQLIWGLFGYWGTMGGVFGLSGLGSSLSLQQALANTRSDGLSSLYREGTASLLNSMVNNRYPFTTQQVKDRFMAALTSEKSAAAQAQLFKQANEGHFKLRA